MAHLSLPLYSKACRENCPFPLCAIGLLPFSLKPTKLALTCPQLCTLLDFNRQSLTLIWWVCQSLFSPGVPGKDSKLCFSIMEMGFYFYKVKLVSYEQTHLEDCLTATHPSPFTELMVIYDRERIRNVNWVCFRKGFPPRDDWLIGKKLKGTWKSGFPTETVLTLLCCLSTFSITKIVPWNVSCKTTNQTFQ